MNEAPPIIFADAFSHCLFVTLAVCKDLQALCVISACCSNSNYTVPLQAAVEATQCKTEVLKLFHYKEM